MTMTKLRTAVRGSKLHSSGKLKFSSSQLTLLSRQRYQLG